MFGTKYALNNVGFDQWVDALKEGASIEGGTRRTMGFLKFISDALAWFEKNPTLTGLHVVSIALPEVNKEHNLDIRIRHHISVTALGAKIDVLSAENREEYLSESLPYPLMGGGVYDLKRDHPQVQQFLTMPSDTPAQYHGLLHTLAFEMDNAFGSVFVYHDFGTLSSTPT